MGRVALVVLVAGCAPFSNMPPPSTPQVEAPPLESPEPPPPPLPLQDLPEPPFPSGDCVQSHSSRRTHYFSKHGERVSLPAGTADFAPAHRLAVRAYAMNVAAGILVPSGELSLVAGLFASGSIVDDPPRRPYGIAGIVVGVAALATGITLLFRAQRPESDALRLYNEHAANSGCP